MLERGIISDSSIDSHQILPMKYLWARRYYKLGISNHWIPEAIAMEDDAGLWRLHTLTKEERRLIECNLGFFSAASSLVANNVVLITYRYVTSPECRQYLLRQAYEGAVHMDAIIYCCDTFNLDPEEIYGMYKIMEPMKTKGDFVVGLAKPLLDDHRDLKDLLNIQSFVKDLIGFYLVMEGLFFYSGFAMIRALMRKNKLSGIGKLFSYMQRDVGLQVSFGCDLINTIKAEHTSVWSATFQKEVTTLIKQAVVLEQAYIVDIFPKSSLDGTVHDLCDYVEYVADRLLERIDLEPQFQHKNPLSWMKHTMGSESEEPFFDTRVGEYHSEEPSEWE